MQLEQGDSVRRIGERGKRYRFYRFLPDSEEQLAEIIGPIGGRGDRMPKTRVVPVSELTPEGSRDRVAPDPRIQRLSEAAHQAARTRRRT